MPSTLCAGGGQPHKNLDSTPKVHIAPNDSQVAYNEKYAKGYGVRYPEGHIIRFYERILK